MAVIHIAAHLHTASSGWQSRCVVVLSRPFLVQVHARVLHSFFLHFTCLSSVVRRHFSRKSLLVSHRKSMINAWVLSVEVTA